MPPDNERHSELREIQRRQAEAAARKAAEEAEAAAKEKREGESK
jgi:hypothetical protein